MKRRRFLTIAACFGAAPALAGAGPHWSGRAFGADVSLRIDGADARAERLLDEVPGLLARIERTFSLYDPASELSQLNRTGTLPRPSPWMRQVLRAADRAHHLTDGIFDPTVQPLWAALAGGGDVAHAKARMGWQRVSVDAGVTLAPGQALTLNGIAQGFATDLVLAHLRGRGATQVLADIGETGALGGPFRLGLSDPEAGLVGWRTLRDGAIATSSPGALRLGANATHILNPRGQAPVWSTVSIAAPTATLADALSTAAVFMSRKELGRLKRNAGLGRIVCVSAEGDVISV
ncbi:FAD:protein FMN transferase [Thalassococcus sp. BH17M4-6]|uniref:FAD:protein FMN transferase n=1 Tax=Thalassococcus sp. BH17M4-6 TaxID=3413148 RepID=UPI003BD59692